MKIKNYWTDRGWWKKKKKTSITEESKGWGKHNNSSKCSNYSDKLNTMQKKDFGNCILQPKVKNCFNQWWLRFVLSQPYTNPQIYTHPLSHWFPVTNPLCSMPGSRLPDSLLFPGLFILSVIEVRITVLWDFICQLSSAEVDSGGSVRTPTAILPSKKIIVGKSFLHFSLMFLSTWQTGINKCHLLLCSWSRDFLYQSFLLNFTITTISWFHTAHII